MEPTADQLHPVLPRQGDARVRVVRGRNHLTSLLPVELTGPAEVAALCARYGITFFPVAG